jgi:dienelactone hydrolase
MNRTVLSRALGVLAAWLSLTLSGAAAAAEPQVFRLWAGPAPGSESWGLPEQVTPGPSGPRSISNVRDPTVTVFLPDPAKATGVAMIVLPGGGMRALAWSAEGLATAEWLNSQGIAAIVLKYRTLQLAPQPAGAPPPMPGALPTQLVIRNGNTNPDPSNTALKEVLGFAVEDAKAATRLVRKNAAAWRIDPARVGLLGFSAGGGVAIGAALAERSDAYPDFLVTLYGPSLMDVAVPAHAPPLFIAVGADHQPVANGLIALHGLWKAAGKPSELHIYDQVRGPFALEKGGRPVDAWPQRLMEWLDARGLTKSVVPPR